MNQPKIPETPAGTSLKGKTAIITGANTGLGYETTKQYVNLGASHIIMAVRSKAKGEVAATTLRASTLVSNPSVKIDVFELDLDSFDSVKTFAAKVKAEVAEVDILLLNGGINLMDYQPSASGHERVMQVNCWSNFALALLLLPLLRSTAAKRGSPSHLTIVGSMVQKDHGLASASISADKPIAAHFDDQSTYNPGTRYSDSKLAVAAFIRELAAHVPSSEVIVNNPCPGMLNTSTDLDKNLPEQVRNMIKDFRTSSGRPVEEGGRTLVYATCVAGPELSGQFLQSNAKDDVAPYLDEPAGQTFSKKIWSDSNQEVLKLEPSFVAVA